MTTPTPTAPPAGHLIYVRRIPEIIVPDKRLGRHVKRDSRAAAYPYQRRRAFRDLADQLWQRHIPILNQGNVGSCTGEEEVGVLGTEPFWSSLSPSQQQSLGQPLAYQIYSQAETLDGDGPYPPNDYGSTGSSAAQAALNDKLISGYLHVQTVADMADALQEGPLGVGVNWYSGYDRPDASGFVSIGPSDYVRGGHEFEVRGVKVTEQRFRADNSWGTGYGDLGSFEFSWDDMARLFSEQGDCTKSVPLTAPAPTPVPVPTDPDHLLWYGGAGEAESGGAGEWIKHHHTGANHALQTDLKTWGHTKGYL